MKIFAFSANMSDGRFPRYAVLFKLAFFHTRFLIRTYVTCYVSPSVWLKIPHAKKLIAETNASGRRQSCDLSSLRPYTSWPRNGDVDIDQLPRRRCEPPSVRSFVFCFRTERNTSVVIAFATFFQHQYRLWRHNVNDVNTQRRENRNNAAAGNVAKIYFFVRRIQV